MSFLKKSCTWTLERRKLKSCQNEKLNQCLSRLKWPSPPSIQHLAYFFFLRFCFWLPVCHFCNGLLNDFFFRKVAFIMVVERALGWDLGELGYGLAGSLLLWAVWFGENYLPCLRFGIEQEFFHSFFLLLICFGSGF